MKIATQKSFLSHLRECIKKLKVTPSVVLGTIRFKSKGEAYCPVTLMCKCETGEYVPMAEFFTAGKKVGMSAKLTSSIADAADWGKNPLHKKLLLTCGLNDEN